MADPVNTTPAVPAAMRRAALLVRKTNAGLTVEEQDELLCVLEAPYSNRVLKLFREAVESLMSDDDKVRKLGELVRQLGLEPPIAPEALPEVTEEDVRLICWLRISETPLEE